MSKYPNENVVRYAINRGIDCKGMAVALDIGSGGGANAEALRGIGWTVIELDNDRTKKAHIQKDIRYFRMPEKFFGLILDCNTLCHVESAPYQAIYDGLEEGGLFLSIHPTPETVPIIADGRWTRAASEWDLRDSLKMFDLTRLQIKDENKYWDDRRGAYIGSYFIKAIK